MIRSRAAAFQVERALLLRRFAYGESSLVVQVLTEHSGRVHLVAKGAYRPKSAMYGVLDLFDTLELDWTHHRDRELQTLRAGRLVERRRALSTDLDRYRAGLTVLELTAAAAHPGSGGRMFAVATEALDRIAAAQEPVLATLARFELHFLDDLGLAPALELCAACAGPAPPLGEALAARRGDRRAAFSAGAGGRLCRACASEARAAGRRVGTLPVRVLRAARALAERDPRTAALGPHDLVRVRDFVARFVEFHLESRPKTYKTFLAAPNRNGPAPEPER